MNQRLEVAASSGDINSLYSIIKEDAYVLDHIDQVPFVDSPLHISASAGQVYFCLEMMRLKPSLAKKLNPEGYCPIHLALKNDQTETVFRLADIDQDLVRLQGREGLTLLHIAASEGKDEVLAKLLVSCPKAIKELTVCKESALHIAVKNDKIGALKILLEWTKKACMNSILNWRNDKGNNIMHLAALENKIEMVKLLVRYKVDMKSKNLDGLTAVEILREKDFLGDRKLREKVIGNKILKQLRPAKLMGFVKAYVDFLDNGENPISKEDGNAILVVSVLIATSTYQALLSLPEKDHQIQSFKYIARYELFKLLNTLAFFVSMIEIYLLLPSDFGNNLHLVVPLGLCYVLLIFLQWSSFNRAHLLGLLCFLHIMSKLPAIRRKFRESMNQKKVIKFGSLINRNLSRDTELSQISTETTRTTQQLSNG